MNPKSQNFFLPFQISVPISGIPKCMCCMYVKGITVGIILMKYVSITLVNRFSEFPFNIKMKLEAVNLLCVEIWLLECLCASATFKTTYEFSGVY